LRGRKEAISTKVPRSSVKLPIPEDAFEGHLAQNERMRWSWKIATVAGIPIRVHVTFFLLLVWFFATGMSRGMAQALQSVLFILAAFACVVTHEFGHAL